MFFTAANNPSAQPPKGTRFIQESDLKYPPDFSRGQMLLLLNMIFFRNRPFSTPNKTLSTDNPTQQAQLLGYQTITLNTKNQTVVICHNSYEINILFKGSSPSNIRHYIRNAKSFFLKERAKPTTSFEGTIHKGFNDVLDKNVQTTQQTLYEAIKNEVKQLKQDNPSRELFLSGHSAGGALACICASRLYDAQIPINGIYTYGQPRFADRGFKESYARHLGDKTFRFEQYGDPIPAMPPFHSDNHVHCGQWIPMAPSGHILQMVDQNPVEDTLTRINPQLQKDLSNSLNEPNNIIKLNTSSARQKARDSLQGLFKSLLSLKYSHHVISSYLEMLLQYSDKNHIKPFHSDYNSTLNHNLMLWQLDIIADSTHETAQLFSSDTRQKVWNLRDPLFNAIDDWSTAQNNSLRSSNTPSGRAICNHQLQQKARQLDELLNQYQNDLQEADGQRNPSCDMSMTQAISQSIDAARRQLKASRGTSAVR